MTTGVREAHVTPALRRECERVRGWIERTSRTDVRTRYRLAERFLLVASDRARFGPRAIATLASHAGIPISDAYRDANVPLRWRTLDEVEDLVKRGQGRLRWSHVAALARVTCRRTLEALVQRTIAEGLRVSEIKALAGPGARLPAPARRREGAAIQELAKTGARTRAALVSLLDMLVAGELDDGHRRRILSSLEEAAKQLDHARAATASVFAHASRQELVGAPRSSCVSHVGDRPSDR